MSVSSAPRLYGVPALPRDNFNALAGQQNLPFRWSGKAIENPAGLSPDLIEFRTSADRDFYVKDGAFTDAFRNDYLKLVEIQRRQSVSVSLAEGRTVVIETDLTGLPPEEKRMVKHLQVVAKQIEDLYMKQQGSYQYIDEVEKIKNTHYPSYELFWRNQQPWADAPKTASDPYANALPYFPEQKIGIYPADAELTPEFFDTLKSDKDLRNPWTAVVRNESGGLSAVPYHVFFAAEMGAIAQELDFAADAIQNVKDEQKLYDYLRAAAQAFRDGDWDAADEKWVAMTMQNSKYALRVAPDETYWEPGNMKSGFQFWFARIDGKAASLSKALKPHLQSMEDEFAKLVPLYASRSINMELPDFIEVVLRSGDHRSSLGATIGEKLPNFNDKHSRMVVMTNYYTDDTSKAAAVEKAHLLLDPSIAGSYVPEKDISTINTLLHEMTHSFGVQAANFATLNADGSKRLNEKGETISTDVALGGSNSQVMEELKAQTGSLYWIGWQQQKGLITEATANKLYTDAILWAFGHISRGMTMPDGSPRTYSQLAAIQLRALINSGAITIEDGKYNLHFAKFHATATDLLREVTRIQVMGDRKAAELLRQDIVDGEGFKVIRAQAIRDILAQYPTASFDLRVKI